MNQIAESFCPSFRKDEIEPLTNSIRTNNNSYTSETNCNTDLNVDHDIAWRRRWIKKDPKVDRTTRWERSQEYYRQRANDCKNGGGICIYRAQRLH